MDCKNLKVENALPLFAFELDGEGRFGIIIVAAIDSQSAFQYLNSHTLYRRYSISFDKMVQDSILVDDKKLTKENICIVYKHFIDV